MASRFGEPTQSLNDPNAPKAFRSFWQAPAGEHRGPESLYDYDPQAATRGGRATAAGHGHSHGHDDHDHDHEHDHGHSHGGGHAHEDTPLLASGESQAGSDRRIFGLFRSWVSLCYCLIPLLLVLLILGFFFYSSTSSTPPLIIAGSSQASSSIAAFCNPFAIVAASVDLAHHHGLVAYLFLLPLSSAAAGSSTSYYLAHSDSGNTTFFFSSVDTPTRIFTRVFQAGKASSGEQLLLPAQYFLLAFHTVLAPSSPSAAQPYDLTRPFQLALISDDGSALYGADLPESSESSRSSSLLIDNDGVHTTRIAYSSVTLNLSAPLNLTLRYFQGPPAHIALQLLYRQPKDDHHQDDMTYSKGPADEEGNDLYWTVGREGEPSQPTRRYEQLREAGWRVVPEEWYWLPPHYAGKADIDRKLAAGVNPCL